MKKLSITKLKLTRVYFTVIALVILSACSNNKVQKATSFNTLTAAEVTEGWQLLFDGTTEGQWRGFKKQSFPDNWEVVDGTLHMNPTAKVAGADIADLIFPKVFENFTLTLDWKISEKGNSGIFYLANENDERFSHIWQTAPEMQILDNNGHPDANKGKNGNRKAGSLYDLIPATPQNAMPVGQWNNIEITVLNKTVTHKQNGIVVVQYTIGSPQWFEMIAKSKFPSYNKDWSKVATAGVIGLQDHDDHVWFRNIKIKEH
jgi:hypothetical protein